MLLNPPPPPKTKILGSAPIFSRYRTPFQPWTISLF